MRAKQAPTTERPRRSFWFDPRFGIGVALVVASVAGVTFLVGTADRTVKVWAAKDAINPGDTVDSGDLVLTSVGLGVAGERYLAGGALPKSGVVVTRSVAAGELIPVSAVGASDSTDLASVVVSVTGQLPQSVVQGAVVDLWSARELDGGGYGPPSVLVGSAIVVRLIESNGIIAQGKSSGVEVLVPRDRIAVVLASLTNSDSLSIVPVSVPLANAAGR